MTRTKSLAFSSLLIACFASAAFAAEDDGEHRFGGDLYRAGSEVRISETDVEDLFAAGETVIVEAGIAESVHAAGRTIRVNGAVGGDLYAAGETVEVHGAVTGDIAAAGRRVEIGAQGMAGDDVHLAGQAVVIRGPVMGDASLAGEEVVIAAPISGSVEIRASEIAFAENARIDGTLAYWSSEEAAIPAGTIAPARVTFHEVEDEGRRSALIAFLSSLAVLIVLGAIYGLVFPQTLNRAELRIGTHPWGSALLGILALSALLGAIVVFALTIIGIPLALIALIAVPLALAAGYFTTAYYLGRFFLGVARIDLKIGRLGAVSAVIAGVILLMIVGLVPVLGWLVALGAVLLGIGALSALWFRVERRRAAPA